MLWDITWVTDLTAWGGVATLILLEVILGFDNLVFISMLCSKLPEKEQNKAFTLGLSLALVMRLGLLSVLAWLVTLTTPLFTIGTFGLTARDLLLSLGGVFLVYKATCELRQKLHPPQPQSDEQHTAVVWKVVSQIVVLDMVFSLDSMITAIGMVPALPMMMLSTTVAVGIMLLAARPLTLFLEGHPSAIILCLGFLFLIGASLILDSAGITIPKGYLYAIILFSICLEGFNQWIIQSRKKQLPTTNLREATAHTILQMLGGESQEAHLSMQALSATIPDAALLAPQERHMVARVIRMGNRTVRYIMTPRQRIPWLNALEDSATLLHKAGTSGHAFLPIFNSETDEVLGIVDVREWLWRSRTEGPTDLHACIRSAPIFFEHTPIPDILQQFKEHPAPLGLVLDEYGSAVGVVTTMDLLAALVGHMGHTDMDAYPRNADDSWLLPANLAVDTVFPALGLPLPPDISCSTLGGFIMESMDCIPNKGQSMRYGGYIWTVAEKTHTRIDWVHIRAFCY
ncbi:MAG: transporter associated domain-containing protein [Desulfovibrionaceae bacterium]